MKLSPMEVWKELESGRNYKTQEKVFFNASQNERMVVGEHWHGKSLQNLAPTVYNFIGQVHNTMVSTVMSSQVSIVRTTDEMSKGMPEVEKAVSVFTQLDKQHWERTKMDSLNEKVLSDAYITGLGGTFWYWDDELMAGNRMVTKGDFAADRLDAVQLYVSNPNETDIQKQDWIIISVRKTIMQLKRLAKAKGVPQNEIDMIAGDETVVYEAYDKAQVEQESYKSDQATFIVKLYKENGEVMCYKSTQNVQFGEPYSTKLTRYPVAIMNWEDRKKFIYGHSPITPVVANQITANVQSAIRHLHAQLMAIPKLAFNKNMVSGISNSVGGIIPLDLPQGTDLSTALKYFQPTAISFDMDKSIDQSIERTKNLMGANQAVLGESNPENFRAIMAQQKAAGVPIESVSRRFKQYVEDVALIWSDFYKNKYNITRGVKLEDGTELTFTGDEFKDIDLMSKVEVGASTQYSEIMQYDALKELWGMGVITDPIAVIEAMPGEVLPNKTKMVEAMKAKLAVPPPLPMQSEPTSQIPLAPMPMNQL